MEPSSSVSQVGPPQARQGEGRGVEIKCEGVTKDGPSTWQSSSLDLSVASTLNARGE